jgi:aspartyl-tRNA(Asn)/glutamyl-tRNA(Gln) amidotransferase subunit A
MPNAGPPHALSVIETARHVRSGQLTAVAVVETALERIAAGNAALNAFVYVDEAGALAAARRVDAALAAGEDVGPLAGVPFGVKDLDDCIGMPTSLGSLLFKDGPPATHEPPLVSRLRAAGAIPVGKTATPEFGCSSSTRSRAWGVTRNPWDVALTPGGSSGGSAAAVAAGMVPVATGTDVGGSIRSPASLCGLVGLKPSQGLIPSDGRVGPGQLSDMHCWGVLTRTVSDTALLLGLAAGPSVADRASLGHTPGDYLHSAQTLDVRGLRVGWSPDLGFAVVDPEVVAVAESACARLIAQAELERRAIDLDLSELRAVSLFALELRALLEAAGHYPARADLLDDEVRHVLEQWTGPSFVEQGQIHQRRAALQRRFAQLFEEIDVLCTPATACVAFPAGDADVTEIAGGDATRFGSEPFSRFANACWLPAISVPAGVSATGLPIGVQLMAPYGREDVLLRLARQLEQTAPWPLTAPGWPLT